jgi:hypothetical protein
MNELFAVVKEEKLVNEAMQVAKKNKFKKTQEIIYVNRDRTNS